MTPGRRYTPPMTRSRKIELVAWALAGLCLGCFLLSSRYRFSIAYSRLSVGCLGGSLVIDFRPTPVGFYTLWDRVDTKLMWAPAVMRSGRLVIVPFWMPFVLFVTVAALAHRRARGLKPGTCRKCGYDLTGNVTGKCSECGAGAVIDAAGK